MRIGVTGGAGFIGGYVVDALVERGHEPVIFDRGRDRQRRHPGVDLFFGDVTRERDVFELAAHVDGIIHLAAVLGTQETIGNPTPAAETNIYGGLNFLRAITLYDLPGAYICVGNHWMLNPYSITKTTIEKFCRMFATEHGTRVNMVRAVNAYGPHQRAAAPYAAGKVRKITPAFVCRALCGEPIEVYGNGDQVSDMVWVGDVAMALVHSVELAAVNDVFAEVVEVGPARSATVNEVAELVSREAERHTGIRVPVMHLPMRPGEIANDKVTADVATLRNVGWSADDLVPLEVGMARTVDWFVANEGVTWLRP